MSGRNSPARVTAAMKRQRILELRTLGQTLEQIGQDPQVGLAKSNVKKHLDKALDELAAVQAEATQRFRALAFARLERMLGKAMLAAAAGNFNAMGQARGLIMAQARLMGFDAPIKHTQTDPTGEVERLPPGTWMLPSRPDASIEEWQQEAERVWLQQRQREASIEG